MATKDKKKTEAKEKKPIASKENEALDSSESTDSLESSEDRVIALSDIVSKTSQFSNRLVMISSGILALLLLGIGIFTFLLSSRIGFLDESNRLAIARIEEIGVTIEKLATAQSDFGLNQIGLSVALEKAGINVTEIQNNLPAVAAKSMKIEVDKVVLEVAALKQVVREQNDGILQVSGDIGILTQQIMGVESQLLANLSILNADVTALVTLEKAKYLSVLERQTELQKKQKGPLAVTVPRDPNLIFYSIQSSED
tara:strand:- start:163 stop:927 length:765 start_codon:yes stop_codon:yes gene_type:complete